MALEVAPATEAPVEEKKPAKEKKEKRPKVRVQSYKLYKIEGETATRLRRECPRCGKGAFMAEHKDRLTCGRCGYTTFRSKTS